VAHLFLTGGGADHAHLPFAEAVLAGGNTEVAVIVLDAGDATDLRDPAASLERAGLRPEVHVVAPGRAPRVGDPAGVFVAGGLTPGYQAALCPDPSWLPRDAIYGGFSAGAAVAAEVALVGGWRSTGVPVCGEAAAEGLDEVEIRSGLALLEPIVDVHCAQWGTLGRLAEVVRGGDGRPGWGLDEDTTLELRDGVAVAVHGTGTAWRVEPAGDGVTVRPHRAGAL